MPADSHSLKPAGLFAIFVQIHMKFLLLVSILSVAQSLSKSLSYILSRQVWETTNDPTVKSSGLFRLRLDTKIKIT